MITNNNRFYLIINCMDFLLEYTLLSDIILLRVCPTSGPSLQRPFPASPAMTDILGMQAASIVVVRYDPTDRGATVSKDDNTLGVRLPEIIH